MTPSRKPKPGVSSRGRTATAKGTAQRAPAGLVVLLRGVNVGGKNRLAMADLAAACTALGCRNVRTYIQSGNVVADAATGVARSLAQRLRAHLVEHCGIDVPVVLRTADELRAVAAASPFLRAGAPEEQLFVGFLADRPTPAQVAALDPARSPGDEFAVVGRDVHMRLGNGAADTKLTAAWFDGRLGTTITVRNWRTVLQLTAMVDGRA